MSCTVSAARCCLQALQQRMRDLQMVADTAQRECEYEVLQATKVATPAADGC